MSVLLEVCVDTITGARSAMRGSAGRVELCSALSEGGLTPSSGLMQAAAALDIPCYAMIRPRSGLFRFSPDEVEIMLADIRAAIARTLQRVVVRQLLLGDLRGVGILLVVYLTVFLG